MRPPQPSHLRLITGAADSAAPRDEADASRDMEVLFRRHAAFVARLAFRLLGREDEVDDVVQDVFFDLTRQIGTLERPDELRGWLSTVTVRAARKRLRRARLRMVLGRHDSLDYESIAAADAPHEHRVMLRALYRALDRLPVENRMAWTLRHLEGEALETVAERCEVSLATAKRRIRAAHTRLTKEMGEWTSC